MSNGCGGIQRIELRTAGNTLVGSGQTITYLLPTALAARGSLAQQLHFAAHPNPFGAAGLHLTLTTAVAPGSLSLSLHDVTGRLLLHRPAQRLGTGTTTIDWPEAARLPAGLYLVSAQLADGSSTVLRVVKE